MFSKSMRLSHVGRQSFSSGRITNMMTNDAESLQMVGGLFWIAGISHESWPLHCTQSVCDTDCSTCHLHRAARVERHAVANRGITICGPPHTP